MVWGFVVFLFFFVLFFFSFFCFHSSVLSVYFLGLLFLLLTITSIGWPPGNDGVELTAVVPVEGDEDSKFHLLILFHY
jgi:hypothetical protein